MDERGGVMSYQRVMDNQNKKTAKTINSFHGLHYGYSYTDQPDEYANICDFDVTRNSKMTLRDGRRKNMWRGYPDTVDNVISINLGSNQFLGQFCNGVLTVYPVSDMLVGIRRYYTVSELAGLTVSQVAELTVNDLILRGGK